jgi:hypothetical protein
MVINAKFMPKPGIKYLERLTKRKNTLTSNEAGVFFMN